MDSGVDTNDALEMLKQQAWWWNDLDGYFKLLDPELSRWRSEGRFIILKHPLLFLHAPMPPDQVDSLMREKRRQIKDALLEGHVPLMWWEKPYRLDVVQGIWTSRKAQGPARVLGLNDLVDLSRISDEEIREALADAWIQTEMIGQLDRRSLTRLFREVGGWITDEEGRLPPSDPITVYRGVQTRSRWRGMSWTTDFARAEWFARRWMGPRHPRGYVYEVTARPEALLGYFRGRGESEYVVDTSILSDRDIRLAETYKWVKE